MSGKLSMTASAIRKRKARAAKAAARAQFLAATDAARVAEMSPEAKAARREARHAKLDDPNPPVDVQVDAIVKLLDAMRHVVNDLSRRVGELESGAPETLHESVEALKVDVQTLRLAVGSSQPEAVFLAADVARMLAVFERERSRG